MNDTINKIMVVGCCGAGKSTLSFKLAEHFDLPLFHLDQLNWKANWELAELGEYSKKHQEVIGKPKWIIDGNYRSTMQERLEKADMVICLDLPRWQSVWGILKRWIQHRGTTRPDMTEGCHERLDWEFIKYVWSFLRDQRPQLLETLSKFQPQAKLHFIRSRKEANQLLDQILKSTDPNRTSG